MAFAKLVAGRLPPIFLAGLLYLGCGVCLGIVLVVRREDLRRQFHDLSKLHLAKLIGAVISGGILAPIFFVYGIRSGTAFEVSLLLNLETVTTTLFAWLIFHEYIGWRVWMSKVLFVWAQLSLPWRLEPGADDGNGHLGPHSHPHTHEPISHDHAHWPDSHHRHTHNTHIGPAK